MVMIKIFETVSAHCGQKPSLTVCWDLRQTIKEFRSSNVLYFKRHIIFYNFLL